MSVALKQKEIRDKIETDVSVWDISVLPLLMNLVNSYARGALSGPQKKEVVMQIFLAHVTRLTQQEVDILLEAFWEVGKGTIRFADQKCLRFCN